MKFYNENNYRMVLADLGLNANDIEILQNANKYLSRYSNSSDKRSMIHENNNMVGSGYNFDINTYYCTMDRYVRSLESYVMNGKHVSNFAELFCTMAELEDESLKDTE